MLTTVEKELQVMFCNLKISIFVRVLLLIELSAG